MAYFSQLFRAGQFGLSSVGRSSLPEAHTAMSMPQLVDFFFFFLLQEDGRVKW